MATYFCRNCGSATESASNIPKFCSECSTTFNSNITTVNHNSSYKKTQAKTTPQIKRYKPVIQEPEEEIQIQLEMPNDNSVEIVGTGERGIKFEQVLNQKPLGNVRAPITVKSKKAKQELKQKLISDFQNESKGMDRNNTPIIGIPGEE